MRVLWANGAEGDGSVDSSEGAGQRPDASASLFQSLFTLLHSATNATKTTTALDGAARPATAADVRRLLIESWERLPAADRVQSGVKQLFRAMRHTPQCQQRLAVLKCEPANWTPDFMWNDLVRWIFSPAGDEGQINEASVMSALLLRWPAVFPGIVLMLHSPRASRLRIAACSATEDAPTLHLLWIPERQQFAALRPCAAKPSAADAFQPGDGVHRYMHEQSSLTFRSLVQSLHRSGQLPLLPTDLVRGWNSTATGMSVT